MKIMTTAREQQRVAHLVMGQPRPAPELPARPAGLSRQEWKAERRRIASAPRGLLLPGVEEQVALSEAWSSPNATPETRQHAASEAMREGALARLVATGALDAHQLAAAEAISEAHAAITADVAVRTAKWERSGGGRGSAEFERLGSYLRDRAYARWRAAAAPHAAMLLAIIVDDIGLTIAARRWRVSNRRAKRLLVDALDSWRRG